jgi:maltose alpha-D-glucosyltransferase/alpha-amylase
VAQRFVESEADGWRFALDSLRAMLNADKEWEQLHSSWLEDMQLLGETTADLHLQLASASSNREFSPEPITHPDVEAWESEAYGSLERVQVRLGRINAPDEETSTLIEAFMNALPGLSARRLGFERLVGCSKIRVHGDYHLGQTLRTTDKRFVVLDFEGEPSRPIAERRAKSSPLKDVAGMFRSFNYARGVTERAENGQSHGVPGGLINWERETREAFLSGYLDRARSGHARFLPDSAEDVREALAAWELHKALYEVLYELDNRPSWLGLPLAATLKLA